MPKIIQDKVVVAIKNCDELVLLARGGFRSVNNLNNSEIRLFPTISSAKQHIENSQYVENELEYIKVKVVIEIERRVNYE